MQLVNKARDDDVDTLVARILETAHSSVQVCHVLFKLLSTKHMPSLVFVEAVSRALQLDASNKALLSMLLSIATSRERADVLVAKILLKKTVIQHVCKLTTATIGTP